ncbi:GNAT family N-acetyltransferase [Hoeflea sp.]|uniref:GNAT family N-acetyltransferase n=1 Tax=Hoeflea sp. TaxID=1940281 RepID=UPI003B023F79
MEGHYTFRTVTDADFDMLRKWLRTPAVAQWWGDPDHELGLMKRDLADGTVTSLIVAYDGTPFAYAQHYNVDDWPQAHLKHIKPGTRAIDTFVGVPEMLGAGHGAAFLRALAIQLIEDGASGVVIDPDPENARARRAYEKAGFSFVEEVPSENGPAIVMHFVPDDAQSV